MTTTSRFNVEATLNAWLQSRLAAFDRPSWLTTYSFLLDMPDSEMPTPAVTVTHIPIDSERAFMGDYVGTVSTKGIRASAFMEINLWVNKLNNASYMGQLRTLDAWVDNVVASTSAVVIQDYYSDPANPTAMGYKVNIVSLTGREVQPDPNPNLLRRRLLLRYDWIIRV